MRSYSGILVPFGETVVFRHPHSKTGRKPGLRIRKGDLRNELGLFVGKSIDTDESYVMTLEGTVTTRTIRRLPVEQQNNLDLLVHGAGVPWNTKLGQKLKHRPVTLPAVVGDTATGSGSTGDHAGEAQPNLEVIPEGDEEAATAAEQQEAVESEVPQDQGK